MSNLILMSITARLIFVMFLVVVFLYGSFKNGRTSEEEKEFFVEGALYVLTFEVLILALVSVLISRILEQVYKTYSKSIKFIINKIIK